MYNDYYYKDNNNIIVSMYMLAAHVHIVKFPLTPVSNCTIFFILLGQGSVSKRQQAVWPFPMRKDLL